jgi:hypothetical protein
MGNFRWHGGKFGFYDGVRREAVDWIQYEDAEDRPYYYDPVYGISQYRHPEDANVVHYTVLERAEYDAVHGEGTFYDSSFNISCLIDRFRYLVD